MLKRLDDSSTRFLLWIEWLLLGLSGLSEFNQPYELFEVRSPLISLSCIVLLALLGLRIPTTRSAKLGYVALHLLFILLATLVGHIHYFFLLCVVPVMRGYLIFERIGQWGLLTIMSSVFVLLQIYRIQSFGDRAFINQMRTAPEDIVQPFFLGSIVVYFLVLVFLHLTMTALLSAQASRKQLVKANAQLRQYALQVEEIAVLQERTRIAREIHDALGHSLTALNLNLNAAIGLWDQELSESKSLLSEAQLLSKEALKDVRQAVATLRSEPLSGQPLEALIQDLLTQLQQTNRIRPICTLSLLSPLSESQKVTAYRIVQEAITNIIKHAHASQVKISLQAEADRLDIVIQDNGKGFDRSQTASGFGLRGMEERVLALGGILSIETAPKKGCKITVQLPLRKR